MAVGLQRRLELTPEETVRLILADTEALLDNPHELEPALDELQALVGLSNEELEKVVQRCPKVLGLVSVPEKQSLLSSRLDALRSVIGLEDAEIRTIVKRFPKLLLYDLTESGRGTESPMAKAKELRALLALDKQELRKLVTKHPQVITLEMEANVKPTIELLQQMLQADRDDSRRLVMRYPQVLGLSVEANLRPKLSFLLEEEGLGLTPADALHAVLKTPLALGASLSKSLRPNLDAYREVLPHGTDVCSIVRERGLRWLTCNAESRTIPRLREAALANISPHDVIRQVRMTDAQWNQWLTAEEGFNQGDRQSRSEAQ